VLILIGFDATSQSLLDELCESGRMPRFAALRREGTKVPLTTPASLFPAGAFTTLWSGMPIGDHGLHYPFMWHAATQQVLSFDHFDQPPGLWERLSENGGRALVVDPYEAPPPVNVKGLYVSGWQFTNRVVLRSWERPPGALADWKRRFGPGPRAEEVFGEPDQRRLLELARVLVPASARAADLVAGVIGSVRPDVLVVSFPSMHVAGHQLWNPAVVLQDPRPDVVRELEQAFRSVYFETDAALGRILDAAPADADVVVFSILGMAADTSRTDMLGSMLGAVLDGRRLSDARPRDAWGFRANVPASWRARVADLLPDRVATALAARLELRGVDWKRTRAFVVPSDFSGFIRFNVRGRERDGIVEPTDVAALGDEIRSGLETFVLPNGEPAVTAVVRTAEVMSGEGDDLLPDLVVKWSPRPTVRAERLSSPRFGTVQRHGAGTGRSGNHTDDAWALVVPRSGRIAVGTTHDVIDIAATALARFGVEAAGRTLLE